MTGQRRTGDPLTIRQAADLLGVSTRTVRRQLSAGRIDGEKVDGRWRVWLDVRTAPDTDRTMPDDAGQDDSAVERLESEVRYLREKLDAAEAEKRALLVTVDRLTRALPPPSDDDAVTVRGGDSEPDRERWWRRWF